MHMCSVDVNGQMGVDLAWTSSWQHAGFWMLPPPGMEWFGSVSWTPHTHPECSAQQGSHNPVVEQPDSPFHNGCLPAGALRQSPPAQHHLFMK